MERMLQKQLQDQSFLEWCSFKIRHAYNNSGRECIVSLPDHDMKTVDGYVEWQGIRLVFEFYGCYWHGCPVCNVGRMSEIHHTRKQHTLTCTYTPKRCDKNERKRELSGALCMEMQIEATEEGA